MKTLTEIPKTSEASILKALTGEDAMFDFRKFLCVPNVYWGWDLNHEADLIAVAKSRYVHEIEVKISLADLKNDLKKSHGHGDRMNRIRYLWYAGPEKLVNGFVKHCPENAGILGIDYKEYRSRHWKEGAEVRYRAVITTHRKAKPNPDAGKIGIGGYAKLARLGTLRYWSRSRT